MLNYSANHLVVTFYKVTPKHGKGDAKAFEREFIDKDEASCDMTFGALTAIYLEDAQNRVRPTTYENKGHIINTKLMPYFRDMTINSITPAVVRKWQNELKTSEIQGLLYHSHSIVPGGLFVMSKNRSPVPSTRDDFSAMI